MIYALRTLLIVVYTILWGVPATLLAPFDRGGRLTCWIARNWIGWIFRTCRIRVESAGLENVDRHEPVVFMSNHQSVVDIGAIVLTLPVNWNFVAKRELGYIPLFGWALAMSVGIMIHRDQHDRAVASMRRAAEKVRGGANVIVFPEGTRSPTGELGPFKSGGFHLVLQAQVPVQPITVSGSRKITPKRSLRVESGTVKIVFGKPIPTAGLGIEDRESLKEQVRAAITAGYDPAFEGPPEAD